MLTLSVSESAGWLRHFQQAWKTITTDPLILSWVTGYRIPFARIPVQDKNPRFMELSPHDMGVLRQLLPQLASKGVITPCVDMPGQFVSPIFLEPKPDKTFRVILNLKNLNSFISPIHFKLEDYRTATRLLTPNCFLATLDLKDAYYLIPVHATNRKYLRFRFGETLYEFTCLPFGLCTAPYVFTKLLKPVVSLLRGLGYASVLYLDDFLLLGATQEACTRNVAITCKLLSTLGFLFSAKKCHFPPTTRVKYLGFIFDSKTMMLELPDTRRSSLIHLVQKVERCTHLSI